MWITPRYRVDISATPRVVGDRRFSECTDELASTEPVSTRCPRCRGEKIGPMRRLHPLPAIDTTVAELYDVERAAMPDGRPRIGICMVSSLDGSTVVEGKSAPLSSDTDTEVLLTLRRLADMILVGAGTVRAENYGAPARPGQRIGVVTASGDLDVSTALFTSGAGFLICTESTPERPVEMLRVGTDEIDLVEAVGRLHEVVPDVSFVQAEGGAQLNGALLHAGLFDELHLTVSPQLVGGSGSRLAVGAGDVTSEFDLVHLAMDDESFLYTRWTRRT
jgi:riboflavin biosynthesis pyrimidine reductase